MREIKLDFKPLIKKLQFASSKFVESEYLGEERSLQKRKSIEFETFKQFSPGDDASMIDWKASLRYQKLLVRQYTQLKTRNIFILMDVGNSMLFSSIPKLKCEYAAELAASLSYNLLKNDDLVGLALFNDHMVRFVPPSFGPRHFFAISKTLGDSSLYGGDFNLTQSISVMHKFIRQGSIVILISDFLGLEDHWNKILYALSAKADIIAFIIRDPADLHLNKQVGHTVIEDPYSREVLFVDIDKIQEQYSHEAAQQLHEIQHTLKKGRIDSLVLDTSKPFIDTVVKFLAKRRPQ